MSLVSLHLIRLFCVGTIYLIGLAAMTISIIAFSQLALQNFVYKTSMKGMMQKMDLLDRKLDEEISPRARSKLEKEQRSLMRSTRITPREKCVYAMTFLAIGIISLSTAAHLYRNT